MNDQHPRPPAVEREYEEYLAVPGSWPLPVPRSTYTILPGIGLQGGRVVKHGSPGWRKAIGAPPALESSERKTVACSRCAAPGHNKRSCKEGK